jgi:hypothetical protein
MFELLDNPAAPEATAADRAAVVAAGRTRRVRRRLLTGGSVTALLVALGLVAVVQSDSPEKASTVDVVDAPESTTTSSATSDPAPSTTTSAAAASPTTTAAPTSTSTPTTTATTSTPKKLEPRATEAGDPSVPPRPGVQLTLRLDRTVFHAGETLHGKLTITNDSSEDVSISPSACSGYHQGLYRDGEWVGGHEGKTCPAVVDPVIVPAGGSHEIAVDFDAYGPGASGPRQPLPPGVYQAAGGFYVSEHEGEARQAWFAPSLDVEITSAPH